MAYLGNVTPTLITFDLYQGKVTPMLITFDLYQVSGQKLPLCLPIYPQ